MVNRWIEISLSLVVQNGCIFEYLFYNVINLITYKRHIYERKLARNSFNTTSSF